MNKYFIIVLTVPWKKNHEKGGKEIAKQTD
jgi:hypothetical protein